MPALKEFNHFDGRHWETGTVANALAYQGVLAPHTGRPYSEALLLGVSGGAAMGYFPFAYTGYDPTARILTRNTFDPWTRMLSRLGVAQDLRRTASPSKAASNLVEALEDGLPAIVWADLWSLPYNALDYDEGMWAMFPILVYGYDESDNVVRIADRARIGLTVTTAALAEARGRVKKDRYRLVTLAAPDADRLPSAVSAGIWDAIKLFTEAPPKGSRHNFGLAAYDHWRAVLTRSGGRQNWEQVFPKGRALWSGLTSAFADIRVFGKGVPADRALYASFLEEAVDILQCPVLADAADAFREAGDAWHRLSELMLPASVPLLGDTADQILDRHEAFLMRGNAAQADMEAIDVQLSALQSAAEQAFPLDDTGVTELQATMADQIAVIRDVETRAVALLREAMAG